jgi:hypothetical protein
MVYYFTLLMPWLARTGHYAQNPLHRGLSDGGDPCPTARTARSSLGCHILSQNAQRPLGWKQGRLKDVLPHVSLFRNRHHHRNLLLKQCCARALRTWYQTISELYDAHHSSNTSCPSLDRLCCLYKLRWLLPREDVLHITGHNRIFVKVRW